MVEVVTLRHFEASDLIDIYGLYHGMDRVFVIKVLIELAGAAKVVVGAGPETDSPLHVMNAGPLGRGQGFHGLNLGN